VGNLLTVDRRFRVLRIGMDGIVVAGEVGEEHNVALGYRPTWALNDATNGHFLETLSSQLPDLLQG